jgi:signal transduction histidine kinase
MRAEALHRLLAKREGLVSELHQANSLLAGAKRMSSMIQQIVDSCQLEAGRLPLRQEPLDLIALVERVIETTGASEQLGRVSLERPGSVPAVLADAGLIERVVGNLLGNALKYSTADRPVVVAVTAGAQEVVVAVKDRGAGIPAESLPHLFERYYRDRKVQQVEGLGLGLYISRLIMEEHGGHIWAESHLGQGSTFTFTLPTV